MNRVHQEEDQPKVDEVRQPTGCPCKSISSKGGCAAPSGCTARSSNGVKSPLPYGTYEEQQQHKEQLLTVAEAVADSSSRCSRRQQQQMQSPTATTGPRGLDRADCSGRSRWRAKAAAGGNGRWRTDGSGSNRIPPPGKTRVALPAKVRERERRLGLLQARGTCAGEESDEEEAPVDEEAALEEQLQSGSGSSEEQPQSGSGSSMTQAAPALEAMLLPRSPAVLEPLDLLPPPGRGCAAPVPRRRGRPPRRSRGRQRRRSPRAGQRGGGRARPGPRWRGPDGGWIGRRRKEEEAEGG